MVRRIDANAAAPCEALAPPSRQTDSRHRTSTAELHARGGGARLPLHPARFPRGSHATPLGTGPQHASRTGSPRPASVVDSSPRSRLGVPSQ
jgi:hypothetical protein